VERHLGGLAREVNGGDSAGRLGDHPAAANHREPRRPQADGIDGAFGLQQDHVRPAPGLEAVAVQVQRASALTVTQSNIARISA
jgi:hypothetical protein